MDDWKLWAILALLVVNLTMPFWIDKVFPSTRGNSMRLRWIYAVGSIVIGLLVAFLVLPQ